MLKEISYWIYAIVLSLGATTYEIHAKIPTAQIKGIDRAFVGPQKKYSPLVGAIYSNNHVIENLYKYGFGNEPIVSLVRMLFNEVPGGEITTTHIANNPASHLSPESVARLIIYQHELTKTDEPLDTTHHIDKVIELITMDPAYAQSIQIGREAIQHAEQEYAEFQKRFEVSSEKSKQATKFEKSRVVKIRRRLKKIAKLFKKAPAHEKEVLEAERATLKSELGVLEKELKVLRSGLLSKSDLREAKRKLNYARKANDTLSDEYHAKFRNFAELLIRCFQYYDYEDGKSKVLPAGIAGKILLAYIWTKYDQKEALKPYYSAMADAGVIPQEAISESSLGELFSASYTDKDYEQIAQGYRRAYMKAGWYSRRYEDIVAMTIERPNPFPQTPTVPFSFVKWVSYSPFPDCVENTLMNYFNHLIYNANDDFFDVTVLQELKNRYYPNLNEKLLDFYREITTHKQALGTRTASKWIRVVSDLNQGFEKASKAQRVHYRSGRRHVASPYTNFVKVVNRLLGYEDIETDHMSEILARVSSITGRETEYGKSQMSPAGFGSAEFRFDQEVLIVRAHKPIHFSFEKRFIESSGHAMSKLFKRTNQLFFEKSMRKLKKNRVDWKQFRYQDLSTLFAQDLIRKPSKIGDSQLRVKLAKQYFFIDYSSPTAQQGVSNFMRINKFQNDGLQMLLAGGKIETASTFHDTNFFDQVQDLDLQQRSHLKRFDQWISDNLRLNQRSCAVQDDWLLDMHFPIARSCGVSYRIGQNVVLRSDGIAYRTDGMAILVVSSNFDKAQSLKISELCVEFRTRWNASCMQLFRASENQLRSLSKAQLVDDFARIRTDRSRLETEYLADLIEEQSSPSADSDRMIYLSNPALPAESFGQRGYWKSVPLDVQVIQLLRDFRSSL